MASEFLEIAERVLETENQPMRAKEIVAHAVDQRMFTDNIAGKTPYQTMKSKLSVDIRRKGTHSRFLRTKPGYFFLRRLLPPTHPEYKAPPYEKPQSHERVLVFPDRRLDEYGRFQGISRNWIRLSRRLLNPTDCRFEDRITAEQDDGNKQVLTYVLITRRREVLCYKRGSYSRVADFLRGSQCVGFGGHVTEVDSRPLFHPEDMGVRDCVIRELQEELQLPPEDLRRLRRGIGLDCIGVLNDDSSPVGRRHFAIIFKYEVSNAREWKRPTRGEKSVTQLRWLRRGDPIRIWDFEYWSQLCLQQFYPDLIDPTADYRVLRRKPFVQPHLLCLVGAVGSGKTEVTKILTSSYGYQEVNSGRLLAGLMGVPPVPTTPRERFQDLAWEFINSSNGVSRLANAVVAHAATISTGRALVDGIRQLETLMAIKKLWIAGQVGILYVHTLPHLAYSFYELRSGRHVPIQEFLQVWNHPVEADVPKIMEYCDAVIYNWTGKRRFREMTHSLLTALGISKCRK